MASFEKEDPEPISKRTFKTNICLYDKHAAISEETSSLASRAAPKGLPAKTLKPVGDTKRANFFDVDNPIQKITHAQQIASEALISEKTKHVKPKDISCKNILNLEPSVKEFQTSHKKDFSSSNGRITSTNKGGPPRAKESHVNLKFEDRSYYVPTSKAQFVEYQNKRSARAAANHIKEGMYKSNFHQHHFEVKDRFSTTTHLAFQNRK